MRGSFHKRPTWWCRSGQGPANIQALDLCCGHGIVTAGLVAEGAYVTGLDFSLSLLGMARAAVPKTPFVEGDAMNLTFDIATFDAVTIGFGMPHVPDPPKVLSEARRVLRPSGRLAFAVWCGPEVDTALGYVFGAIEAHWHPTSPYRQDRWRMTMQIRRWPFQCWRQPGSGCAAARRWRRCGELTIPARPMISSARGRRGAERCCARNRTTTRRRSARRWLRKYWISMAADRCGTCQSRRW